MRFTKCLVGVKMSFKCKCYMSCASVFLIFEVSLLSYQKPILYLKLTCLVCESYNTCKEVRMKAASCWQTSRRVQYTMTERQSRKRGPFSSWMSATSLLRSRDTLSWRWSGSGVSRTTPCPSPEGTPSTPDTLSTVAIVAVAVRPSIVFTPNFSLSTCKDK